MSTDNTGVQTRAMAQRSDGEPQETQNQDMNPTVEASQDQRRLHQGIRAKEWDHHTQLVCTRFLKHQSR